MSLPENIVHGTHEYLYARILLEPQFAEHLLDQDGIFGRKDSRGRALMTFYTYAKNPEEARELVKALRATAAELNSMALDVEQFIDDFDFPEEGSSTSET